MRKKLFCTLVSKGIVAIFLAYSALAQPVEPDTALTLNYLAPTSYLIEDVRITGAKTLAPEVLLSMITIKAGDTVYIPGVAITDAIRKLWEQKLIQDVSIYASRVVANRIILTIDITENPRLSTYTLAGVNEQEQKELREKISLVNGEMVTDCLINDTQKVLQKHLASQGYLDAEVHIVSSPAPNRPGYKQVAIHIDKKQKTIINRILFEGNHNIDHKILKAQMQHIQERPRFTLVRDLLSKLLTVQTWRSLGLQAWRKEGLFKQLPTLEETIAYWKHHVIFSPSTFVQSEYTEDKKRLIHYYQTKGYQDATIVAETICKSKEGLIDVKLRLEEGQRYFIRNITWVGNDIYTEDILNQRLDIHPSDVYNPALIQSKLFGDPAGSDIFSLYMDNGHLFLKAEPITRIAGNAVDLVIRIQEGPQAYINRVKIQGNTYTHDEVIRRALRTLPGDKFSRAELSRSQRELAILNIFDPNELKVISLPNPENATVDLAYVVKELPKSELNFSGAVNDQEASIDLKFSTNNFSLFNALRGKFPLGAAQTISLDLTGAINLKKLWDQKDFRKNYGKSSLRFEDPGLGLGIALGRAIQYDYKNHSWEGEFTFSKMLGWLDYMNVRGRLSFLQDFYKDYQDPDFLDGTTAYNGVINETGLQVSLERNSMDNSIYPTQGSKLGLYTKLTPPYSQVYRQGPSQDTTDDVNIPVHLKWAEYHQWIGKGAYFKKLFGDWVLNIQCQAGIVGGYTQTASTSFGRFVMGGTTAMHPPRLRRESIPLRGYPEKYILPQADSTDRKGGTLFDKFVLELRHPLGKSIGAYGLIFAEAGNAGLTLNDSLPWALKRSVGVGIRLHTPLGPVGIDVGFGLDKEAERDKIEVHFLFGGGIQ